MRFWESKFTQVKPVKRAGGRRYYRPGDMELLGGIKKLLHEDGMTIKGVQKILREQGVRHVAGLSTHLVDAEVETIEDAPYTEVEVEDQPAAVLTFPSEEPRRRPTRTDPHTPDLFAELDAVQTLAADTHDLIDDEDDPWLGKPRAPQPEEIAPVDAPVIEVQAQDAPAAPSVEIDTPAPQDPVTIPDAAPYTESHSDEAPAEEAPAPLTFETTATLVDEPVAPDIARYPAPDIVPAPEETGADSEESEPVTEESAPQDALIFHSSEDSDPEESVSDDSFDEAPEDSEDETPQIEPRTSGILTVLSAVSHLTDDQQQELLPHLVAVRALAAHYYRPTHPLD